MEELNRAKPASSKGRYVKKIAVSTDYSGPEFTP